jgi:hypothetical protein
MGFNFNKGGPPKFSNKGKKKDGDNLRDVINQEKDKE